MNTLELHSDDDANIVNKAIALVEKTSWLTPVAKLLKKAASQFGRNIESSLYELENDTPLTLIQLHKRDKAVVMSVEHYSQLLEMSKVLESLLEKQRMDELSHAGDGFELMYQELTEKNAGNAAKHLLTVNEESLAETFQPGKTETR